MFAVLTYMGHRHRKKFLASIREDREAWSAAAERLIRALEERHG
jgi:hypothetical protein